MTIANGQELVYVDKIQYFGAMIEGNNSLKTEILPRAAPTALTMTCLKSIWTITRCLKQFSRKD